MVEEVKIFSDTDSNKLMVEINAWFAVKGYNVNVTDRKFCVNVDEDGDPLYSVAIFYQERKKE
jgi:hypothetical protein